MQQMKNHGKNPQNQTNEEEIGSLPEKELRVIIVKMIQNFRNNIEEQMNRMDCLFHSCKPKVVAVIHLEGTYT